MKRFIWALLALLFLSLPANAATCYWVGGTGNFDNTNTASWASGTGGTASTCAATGGIPKNAGDIATFDGASGGGTVTVCGGSSAACPTSSGLLSLATITMGAFTGTLDFDAIDPNVTLTGTLNISGTGARTLSAGSGTWTFTSNSGSIFEATTLTNFSNPTTAFSSATLTFTATTASTRSVVTGAAMTFGTINVGANTSAGQFNLSVPNSTTLTISTFNVTAPNRLLLNGGTARTYAFTNGFSLTGSAGSTIEMTSSAATFPTVSSANTMGGTYMSISGLAFAGGGNLTATSSFDGGGVSISGGGAKSITAPSGGGSYIIGG